MSIFGNNNCTAIQIKDHVIRYVTTKKPSLSTLKSSGESYLPEGIIEKGKIVDRDKFKRILRKSISRWKLKKQEIRFFVPDSSVFFRKLTIPKEVQKDEIRGYLNFEIGQSIHLPFEDAVFDFQLLEKMEENDAQREILFFATPASIMKDYNDLFEELNLTPIVADVSSLSFYRLFYELTEAGEDQHFLFVEWDLSSLNLCIFHRDKPVFMRHISQKFTYDDWTMEHEGGITHLHCNNDEKVEKEINEQLQEVERVMNFYKYTFNKGEDEITNIILAGDHPKLQYIRNSLDEIDGTVKSLDEMDLGIHYHYILPLSLCLKEVVK